MNINIKNISASFKNRKFKYGGYAALITAAVIAILLIINLLVGQIPLKFDLTHNKLYSLSKQTIDALKGVKKEVTIYEVFSTGNENPVIKELIQKYSDKNNNIKIKFIDPYKNPGFLKKYSSDGSSIDEGSIIIESGSKFRVLSYYDIIDYNYDQTTGQSQITGLSLESKLTPAILYVTSEKNPVIYELQGHGEDSLSTLGVQSEIETANFEIKSLNLVSQSSVPADATAVLVSSPKTDLTEDEMKKLKSYLTSGGRALFLMDIGKSELKNFNALFESYGVKVENGIVMEGDNNFNAGNPVWLLPQMETHDIVNPIDLNNMYVLIPYAQPIVETKIKKRTVTIEKLLTTTSNSWLRKNLESTSLSKEKGDVSGPFTVAVAITDKADALNTKLRPQDTKIVIIGSAIFLNSQYSSKISGNLNLALNSLNWLQDKKDTFQVPSKDLTSERLNISTTQSFVLSGIVVIIIPVIIFVLGLTVWLRRRHL